GKITR
ncbi:hypothetical protein D047_3575B, partial [Vibrio parahaemolyticus VPTS-2010_2]